MLMKETEMNDIRPYKFEGLEIWKLSLEYLDELYDLAAKLPKSEDFNLKSQLLRAGTSISLNIAEGSTGQSDAAQARFLSIALRSLVETVACLRITQMRELATESISLSRLNRSSHTLAAKIQAMKRVLAGGSRSAHEDDIEYR